jgi:hypothetical protein
MHTFPLHGSTQRKLELHCLVGLVLAVKKFIFYKVFTAYLSLTFMSQEASRAIHLCVPLCCVDAFYGMSREEGKEGAPKHIDDGSLSSL